MRPTPYPKKIDWKEKVYYHYKIDAANYALFDSEMNTPAVYGSFNLVAAVITNLPESVTIFYFETDERTGWKMKRSYKPDKKTATDKEKKNAVQQTEANKKKLT
jgi:hypothetical protein